MSETIELWTEADLLAAICAGRTHGMHRTRRSLKMPVWNAGLASIATMTEAQLAETLGIRRKEAHRLRLAFALHRWLLAAHLPERPDLRLSDSVARTMQPLVQLDHERLWCLALDPRIRLIGEPIEITRGDVDGTEASSRAFFRAALRTGATSVIAVHNHPSGDPSPSSADAAVTRRLVAAGRAIDLPLADHVVVCADGRFASLRRDQPECFR